MASQVRDRRAAAAIDQIAAGLHELLDAELTPVDEHDAERMVTEIERLGRRLDAIRIRAMDAIDASGRHRPDGYSSAKTMVRHLGDLSLGEAAHRQKTMQACRDLPQIAAAHAAGELSTDHLRVIARVHANQRVREAMIDQQERFLDDAARLSHHRFSIVMGRWERLVDSDGAAPANVRAHEQRDASLIQDHFDLTWNLRGNFGAYQGADVREIWDHYIAAERLADWEKARAEHGDGACEAHLPRTEAQRRADALWQLCQDAATNPNGAVPVGWVHNIVWDADTFEEMTSRLDPEHDPQPLDPDTHRCETINGTPLEPTEAFALALQHAIRRVLVDAPSAKVDLGEARFFTGAARHAVKLASTTCVWPSCQVPVDHCEADHLVEHSRGGRTYPGNGAPLCGKHNRWKQKGHTVWRDPAGEWHTYRPDGTEIR